MKQEPEVGARVYAYLLDDGKVGETFTDANGYFSLRIQKGYIVDLRYDSPDKNFIAWAIADKLPVDRNKKFDTVVVGQK